MLEGILIARATGYDADDGIYQHLRLKFINNHRLKKLLPEFLKVYGNLSAFWGYIKREAATYAERREIISKAFTPMIDFLETSNALPGDKVTSDALEIFDVDSVHAIWSKAIERRVDDPEGAITIAKTLLETVAKRILDECNEPYTDKDDLPKLYYSVSKILNLAPSQHTEEPIKMILGGATTIVNGLGTLRNRLSDSHGRGKKSQVKPSVRHANLAVNTAGAIATFLTETYLEKRQNLH